MSMTDALTTKPMARPAVAMSGGFVHPQHKNMGSGPQGPLPDNSKGSAGGRASMNMMTGMGGKQK